MRSSKITPPLPAGYSLCAWTLGSPSSDDTGNSREELMLTWKVGIIVAPLLGHPSNGQMGPQLSCLPGVLLSLDPRGPAEKHQFPFPVLDLRCLGLCSLASVNDWVLI